MSSSDRATSFSFPPGVARRFMDVTEGEPDTEHLLLFVVSGNGPQADFTPDANEIMRRGGDGLPSAAE
jgi:hypothetical protein